MTTGRQPLSQEAYEFRCAVLDRLDRWTAGSDFWYVDSDTVLVVCPCCGGSLCVRFAGRGCRASVACEHSCAESDVLDVLRSAGQ
jgi:hypothetical protein